MKIFKISILIAFATLKACRLNAPLHIESCPEDLELRINRMQGSKKLLDNALDFYAFGLSTDDTLIFLRTFGLTTPSLQALEKIIEEDAYFIIEHVDPIECRYLLEEALENIFKI